MCQIAFYYKLEDSKSRIPIINEVDLVICEYILARGARSNGDAWGWFSKEEFYKSPGEFIWGKDKINLKKPTRYVAMHNRLATNGRYGATKGDEVEYNNNINNHPFVEKDIRLMHNGILSDYRDCYNLWENRDKRVTTDSYAMLCSIMKYYNEDEGNIRDSILKALPNVAGSISALVGKKGEDSIYYFKNSSTSFSMSLIEYAGTKAMIGIGGTGAFNASEIPWTGEYGVNERVEMLGNGNPFEETLYVINPEGIFSEGKFSFKQNTWSSSYKSGYYGFNKYD